MKKINFGSLFLRTAIYMLMATLFMGCLAAASYIWPTFLKDQIGFISLRPMHVSAALAWILLGATACVYFSLNQLFPKSMNRNLAWIQYFLWLIALVGIFGSYLKKDFGGREYWEFNPIWAIPIGLAWFLFSIQFFKIIFKEKKWPVYYYMWMTGIVFFFYIFIENYLWILPYFKGDIIRDITIQWKVNGSLVGAWNQILYGTSFYLMDKISGNTKVGHSYLTFSLYFLGFFNMLFNWSHHIYTLPTQEYIRFVGYVVSMTEWVFFIKTLLTWKNELTDAKKYGSILPYKFIMASNFWVFLNLIQALCMSIPAINLYTHGTHITVAHAMGTTIGINSMILLAAGYYFEGIVSHKNLSNCMQYFWLLQIGLFVLWLGLILAGIHKGIWQMQSNHSSFNQMMNQIKPWLILFYMGGISASIGFLGVLTPIIKRPIRQ